MCCQMNYNCRDQTVARSNFNLCGAIAVLELELPCFVWPLSIEYVDITFMLARE